MNMTELNNILEKHKKWINEETDGERADLHGTNLSRTDLSRANLRGAVLCGADLSGTNLSGTNLYGADLYGADLRGANLRGVDLYEADLYGADLYGALNIPDYVCPIKCPQEGSFIGFKKAYQNVIVKLRITDDAKRSSATTRKCRCNKAEVVEIYNIDGTIADERIVNSSYDYSFTYEVGKTVEVQDFDTNRWNECTRGIHFFINRQEAINY